jgi:LacI family transcriptional regulator
MRSHQAAGTILCPAGDVADYSNGRLQLGHMRLVAIDNAAPELHVDTISLDNRKAAEIAVRHLLSFGHRRIGTVMGFAHQHVANQRFIGFRDALKEQGIAVDEAFVGKGNFRIEDAYRACQNLLALPERPTALFVANNLMLIGVMRALSEAGVSVPDDISVASIDDFPWASAFQPALTVVRQPIAEMASAALDRLVRRLDGDDGEPQHLVFAPELIIRQSCSGVVHGASPIPE